MNVSLQKTDLILFLMLSLCNPFNFNNMQENTLYQHRVMFKGWLKFLQRK